MENEERPDVNEEIQNTEREDELSNEEESQEEVEETSEVNEDEEKEDLEDTEDVDDGPLADALALNKKLKAELDEVKASTSNVFEENEKLKIELEEQQKLAEMAEENAKMKTQLENIKRSGMVEAMLANGQLNEDLRSWAEELSFEQLEKFAEHAPKRKTILEQKNDPMATSDEDFQKWYKEQSRSRIIG